MEFDPVSYLLGAAAGSGSGSGIRLLEYIASTGNKEYIDTDYKLTDNSVLMTAVDIDSTNPAWASPYGVMESPGVKECIFYAKINEGDYANLIWTGATADHSFSSYYGKVITARHYKGFGQIYSGPNTLGGAFTSSGSASSTYPLFLFTCNDRGTPVDHSFCKMKLYGFDIYEGSTLARMFRPALDPSGVPGLSEFVTGTFFYNDGAGAFLAGGV